MTLIRLLKLQIGVLALGTLFSWSVVLYEYVRLLGCGCALWQVSACPVRNPVLTPCFYGAWAFLAAFVWSLVARRRAPVWPRIQRGLNGLLACGAIFAWSNFGYELYRYATARAPSAFSCPAPGAEAANPFVAPCFTGAMIFLVALGVSLVILSKLGAGPVDPRQRA